MRFGDRHRQRGRQASGGRWYVPTALITTGCYSCGFYRRRAAAGAVFPHSRSQMAIRILLTAPPAWFYDIHAPHEITFNLDGEPLGGQNSILRVLLAHYAVDAARHRPLR
ncbi:hypothetical protein KCP74_14715 [Salmonella enterica subsp. enterica]|nr:hypothetical protein KCP74_14715 [Salmonella enterica subsp. enterica]